MTHECNRLDFYTRKEFLHNISNKKLLAQLIDSTLLKTDSTEGDFLNLFANANQFLFRSVCVPPCYVSLAKKMCENVLVCTVIGFPNGYATTRNKADETKEAIFLGADEIDFVQNITYVKSQDWSNLRKEYSAIVKAAENRLTKIILETSLLTNDEIVQCIKIAVTEGVNIVKTSTGFGKRGASEEDIKIILQTLTDISQEMKEKIGIKASGGVRTFDDAIRMIALGATRIGTSCAVQICQ